jgi:hypothetical protein
MTKEGIPLGLTVFTFWIWSLVIGIWSFGRIFAIKRRLAQVPLPELRRIA